MKHFISYPTLKGFMLLALFVASALTIRLMAGEPHSTTPQYVYSGQRIKWINNIRYTLFYTGTENNAKVDKVVVSGWRSGINESAGNTSNITVDPFEVPDQGVKVARSLGGLVTEIEANAFGIPINGSHCPIKSMMISNSIKVIGQMAFAACPLLKQVSIGSSVESIGTGAFNNCPLEIITCLGTTPPKMNGAFDPSVFPDKKSNNPGAIVKVPPSAVDAYKHADGWKQFKDNIVPLGE